MVVVLGIVALASLLTAASHRCPPAALDALELLFREGLLMTATARTAPATR